MMARFFKDMPPMKGGKWEAVVIRVWTGRRQREVRKCTVTGLRRAYVMARLLALWEDIITPYLDGEVGIQWAVRESKS